MPYPAINLYEAGAVIIGLSSVSSTILLGLQKVKELVSEHNSNWAPMFMIDKDKAERKAIIDFGCKFILCQFHINEALAKEIGIRLQSQPNKDVLKTEIITSFHKLQRNTSEDVLSIRIHQFKEEFDKTIPNYESILKYLDDNWFCSDWMVAWSDILRNGRESLMNTNNPSETWFRAWSFYHISKKNRRTFKGMVYHLVTSFKRAELDEYQFENKLLNIPKLGYEYKFQTALTKAIEIVNSGLVSKLTYTFEPEIQLQDFEVKSQTNANCYLVSIADGTCLHFINQGRPCKHLLAALLNCGYVTCNRHKLSISSASMKLALKQVNIPEMEELGSSDSDSQEVLPSTSSQEVLQSISLQDLPSTSLKNNQQTLTQILQCDTDEE